MHVFLSPHLDDAVYSCGGTIHQLVHAGEDVHVLTIMAGDPPKPPFATPLIADLHMRWGEGESPIAVRRAEDMAAAALLGFGVTHLLVPDCVYRTDEARQPLYPTEAHLWHAVHPHDPALAAVENLQLPDDATHVYAPLGVGGHVDHLIVRELIATLVRRTTLEIYAYVEYPYMEDQQAVTRALSGLSPELQLSPTHIYLTETDIIAKIEGVKAYHSQISTFWDDEDALATRVKAALTQHSETPTEHFYQVR